jgi:hypothetical protein
MPNMTIGDNIEIKGPLAFKYFGSIFTNLGKCKEEMLNRIEQARKVASTLNSLLRGKQFH